MSNDTDTTDSRQATRARKTIAIDYDGTWTADQEVDDADVFAACVRVESRDGPWWGASCIAQELGRTVLDVLPSLERLMAQGRVGSDVCGAGPDGEQVLAWWIERAATQGQP